MPDRFRQHRQELAKSIGSEGAALVPAATESYRNDDVTHEFRQDSNFFYLTGFAEPEAVAVIVPGHPEGDYHLFVRPRDREMEIWNGIRAGVEGARERYQADVAYEVGQLDATLAKLLVGRRTLHYTFGDPTYDARVTGMVKKARSYRQRTGKSLPTSVIDVSATMSDMRLRKRPEEIESLRVACELSAEGHREAMRYARPGLFEYQVQAPMEYVWREGGSRRNGYPSIVASGPNACILHYVENDRLIEDGDLVLIDAACEVDYFSSDITRTFPASGRFSAAQRAVYEVVLTAQHDAISMCRPGSSIRDIHETAKRSLTEGLVELGLLPKSLEDSLAMHHYREFFMHGTSHWLGMDVHDAGSYRIDGVPRALEPAMAFTVEPGLYIDSREEIEVSLLEYDLDAWTERTMIEGAAAKDELEAMKKDAPKLGHPIPAEFRGIGIRIEDDILITTDGHDNLTSRVPRDIDAVEALCSESSWLMRTPG
jgi:Xaa-Pro aminopeptidase